MPSCLHSFSDEADSVTTVGVKKAVSLPASLPLFLPDLLSPFHSVWRDRKWAELLGQWG